MFVAKSIGLFINRCVVQGLTHPASLNTSANGESKSSVLTQREQRRQISLPDRLWRHCLSFLTVCWDLAHLRAVSKKAAEAVDDYLEHAHEVTMPALSEEQLPIFKLLVLRCSNLRVLK